MGEAKLSFSGYATKTGLQCSDGRTIMPDAFKHQDTKKVPLVWQHGHNEPSNVLGHAILENRADGVYCYGYFNGTPHGLVAKGLVEHGDITALSIYANKLVERDKEVLHGAIREVSLVIAGANPGAFIDNVVVEHSDGSETELDDAAIIYTGLTIEHAETPEEPAPAGDAAPVTDPVADPSENAPVESSTPPAENGDPAPAEPVTPEADPVVEDPDNPGGTVEHADETSMQEVYDNMSVDEKDVVHYMIGAALEASGTAEHSSDTNPDGTVVHQEGTIMSNAFENGNGTPGTPAVESPTLSHAQLQVIVNDGERLGSLKQSFIAHAAEYGIENIDILFPDAQSVTNAPEVIGRRMEWVQDVLTKTKHSPFSRIKSTAVDLTADEARAKGYVKGNLKKDEIIKLLKRVTTPKTVYKKQKLDRDDIVDITELDVVAWLKAEMRLMLDEEIARAILVGDGREPDDEDKIDEDHIRPIAYDDEMYAHRVNLASGTSPSQKIEAIVRARRYYKGSGTPTFYTTDEVLTDLILDKDTLGRRYYNTEAELAAALRVDKIVTVEAMEDNPDVIGIIVNLIDYTVGADRGGAVAMFDDFDIDYNQQKYLIETRISGALTKPKSAIVLRTSPGTVVTPAQPQYNATTHVITIPNTTGVIYSIDGVDKAAGATVTIAETTEVESRPAANYSFPHNTDADWVFVY